MFSAEPERGRGDFGASRDRNDRAEELAARVGVLLDGPGESVIKLIVVLCKERKKI